MSTLTGGTGELVREGETGLTYPAGDSVVLANHIARLIDHPELRYQFAQARQNRVVEKFTFERMVDELEALLIKSRLDRSES